MSVPLYQLPEQQPSVWQPTSVEEAMRLKHKWGDDSVLIAGGTWLPYSLGKRSFTDPTASD